MPTYIDPIEQLHIFAKNAGSQKQAAINLGVSQGYVTDLLHGSRSFSPRILRALGLRRIIVRETSEQYEART